MTVNATPPRVQHVTNGVQDTFAFAFRVLAEADVLVFLDDSFTPESPATFTVNLSSGPPPGQDGGDVVMNTPPPTGVLTITRGTPQTQETDYVPFDPFPAETHETGLDKAMMVNQETQDLQSRVFLAPPGVDPLTSLIIPDYDSGKLLQWSVDPDDGLPHRLLNSPVSAAVLAAAIAAAAASAAAAAVSEANASVSAAAAAVSAGASATSAAASALSAGNAATSETNAAASAAAAAASAAAAAFFDVSTFELTPAANGVLRHVLTRTATYDFNGIVGQGFANTVPGAATVFTINKELLAGGTTPLATASFALGANDAVWADVAGVDVTFAAGDRIEIVAPAAVNGIAEVAITVPLLLP